MMINIDDHKIEALNSWEKLVIVGYILNGRWQAKNNPYMGRDKYSPSEILHSIKMINPHYSNRISNVRGTLEFLADAEVISSMKGKNMLNSMKNVNMYHKYYFVHNQDIQNLAVCIINQSIRYNINYPSIIGAKSSMIRLDIIRLLHTASMSFDELTKHYEIYPKNLRSHLRVLEENGIITLPASYDVKETTYKVTDDLKKARSSKLKELKNIIGQDITESELKMRIDSHNKCNYVNWMVYMGYLRMIEHDHNTNLSRNEKILLNPNGEKFYRYIQKKSYEYYQSKSMKACNIDDAKLKIAASFIK